MGLKYGPDEAVCLPQEMRLDEAVENKLVDA